jgi:hypothetical protein
MMVSLDVLSVLRHFFPRLVAVLVVASFYFAPQFSAAVVEHAARERAQQVTSLLNQALESVVADSHQRHSRR